MAASSNDQSTKGEINNLTTAPKKLDELTQHIYNRLVVSFQSQLLDSGRTFIREEFWQQLTNHLARENKEWRKHIRENYSALITEELKNIF